MKQPHIHSEAIKAWADGAQIQVRRPGRNIWVDTSDPSWNPAQFYRVKP